MATFEEKFAKFCAAIADYNDVFHRNKIQKACEEEGGSWSLETCHFDGKPAKHQDCPESNDATHLQVNFMALLLGTMMLIFLCRTLFSKNM